MDNYLYWIHLILVLITARPFSACDCFNFNCCYTSHCRGSSDNTTGICSSTCDSGWAGPTCQAENIALKKEVYADIPITSNGWSKDNIVDGNKNQSVCIPEGKYGDPLFVEVDLVGIYTIKDITIYYRKNALSTFRGFSVYVSLKKDATGVLCYQNKPGDPLTDIKHIQCNLTGRYILIKNNRTNPPYPDGYSNTTDIEICEIQAFVCSRKTFGNSCENQCHCHGNDTCDPVSGLCPGNDKLKCDQGWFGENCDDRCESKYGINCDKLCSDRHCKDQSSCHTYDGSCDDGCLPGYSGIDCVQACTPGLFGDNCSQKCDDGKYCRVSNVCNHVTGICENGCAPGWKESTCSLACDAGFYGQDCRFNCSSRKCENSTDCSPTSGSCNGKCIDGWSGVTCLQECEDNLYGFNCSYDCSERLCVGNSSCNTNDGKCDEGCQQGYLQPDCVFLEPKVGKQVQDNGLDRIYVGLIGVFCGILFCILGICLLYYMCITRWKAKLIVNERLNENLYDDIRDPPTIAVTNNAYEEPVMAIDGSQVAVSFPNANRPLPEILIDNVRPNPSDNVPQAQQNVNSSVNPYINMANASKPSSSTVDHYDEPSNNLGDNKDTDSISTVSSFISDKTQHEKNEVSNAANNIQERKENEYVKMASASVPITEL